MVKDKTQTQATWKAKPESCESILSRLYGWSLRGKEVVFKFCDAAVVLEGYCLWWIISCGLRAQSLQSAHDQLYGDSFLFSSHFMANFSHGRFPRACSLQQNSCHTTVYRDKPPDNRWTHSLDRVNTFDNVFQHNSQLWVKPKTCRLW